MAGLAAFRQTVADTLTAAGHAAKPYVPERLVPPVTLVLPRTPYVDPAEGTACGWWVRLRVVVIGKRGVNEAAADELDSRIVSAVTALDSLEMEIEAVQEPVEVELNGTAYLGTVILTSGITDLES